MRSSHTYGRVDRCEGNVSDRKVCPPRESERPGHLVGILAPGSAIAPLDSRSVRCFVTELFECSIDPFLTAVAMAEFDGDDTHILSVLDDLHVSEVTWRQDRST